MGRKNIKIEIAECNFLTAGNGIIQSPESNKHRSRLFRLLLLGVFINPVSTNVLLVLLQN